MAAGGYPHESDPLFRKLATVVSYLKNVGISQYEVDASNCSP